MKIILSVLALVLLAVSFRIAWIYQPWMRPGQAVQLSSERLGNYDFQVWQRKNNALAEPFATGLFARKQSGQWRVFLLDFEDTFHPKIVLRKEGSSFAVFERNQKLGIVDQTLQTFRRESDGASVEPGLLDGEPPSNWWLKSEKQSRIPQKR